MLDLKQSSPQLVIDFFITNYEQKTLFYFLLVLKDSRWKTYTYFNDLAVSAFSSPHIVSAQLISREIISKVNTILPEGVILSGLCIYPGSSVGSEGQKRVASWPHLDISKLLNSPIL